MAETKEYTVNRAMQSGATSFDRGDIRKLTEAEAAPLVASGALSLKGAKAEEREPAVRHTFGEAPNEDQGYTSAATGERVSVEMTDKRTTTKRK